MDVQTVAAARAQPQQSPPAATLPAAVSPSGAGAPAHDEGVLSPVLAKIFSQGGVHRAVAVNVRYRVEHDPNMIVMVFTDPKTGKEIAQVPSDVMVQLAQFFDKHSGVTLDQNA